MNAEHSHIFKAYNTPGASLNRLQLLYIVNCKPQLCHSQNRINILATIRRIQNRLLTPLRSVVDHPLDDRNLIPPSPRSIISRYAFPSAIKTKNNLILLKHIKVYAFLEPIKQQTNRTHHQPNQQSISKEPNNPPQPNYKLKDLIIKQ